MITTILTLLIQASAPWTNAVAFGDRLSELWALFSDPAPGADEFERRDNEARRGEMAQSLLSTVYCITISDLQIGEYDFQAQRFPIAVGLRGGLFLGAGDARDTSNNMNLQGRLAVGLGVSAVDHVGGPRWRLRERRLLVAVSRDKARDWAKTHRDVLDGLTDSHSLGVELLFRLNAKTPSPSAREAGGLVAAEILGVRLIDLTNGSLFACENSGEATALCSPTTGSACSARAVPSDQHPDLQPSSSRYVQAVSLELSKAFRLPSHLDDMALTKLQVRVLVTRLSSDGAIEEYRIIAMSGDKSFDDAASAAIKRFVATEGGKQRFPPPTPEVLRFINENGFTIVMDGSLLRR